MSGLERIKEDYVDCESTHIDGFKGELIISGKLPESVCRNLKEQKYFGTLQLPDSVVIVFHGNRQSIYRVIRDIADGIESLYRGLFNRRFNIRFK